MGLISRRGYSELVAELTPQMRAVLRCGAQGMTTAETASELGVAPGTVHTIRCAMFVRLSARNLPHAVAIVARRGEL
jgi:DNA-binding CsgD family transcriptional regulator